MITPAASRVLVVCPDIEKSDRIVSELFACDLDPTPAYTAAEAIGVLAREAFEAVVVDEDLEDSVDGLRRWLKAKYRGVVVFTGEPHTTEPAGPARESAEVTRVLLVAMGDRRMAAAGSALSFAGRSRPGRGA